MFQVLLIPALNACIDDQDYVGACHHKNYFFCYHLPTCNNPNFWEIEINEFIKIPNFGDNKNFYFEHKINFLSFKTCEFEHLLPCFK
jgi:hypothetical protein